MRLSHPVDDHGLAEFREAVEHLFDEHPDGIDTATLEQFGWFDLLDEVPEVALPALFGGQGIRLGTGSTLEAFVGHDLRSRGIELPTDVGILITTDSRTFALSKAELYLFSPPANNSIRIVDAASLDLREVRSIDPSLTLLESAIPAEDAGALLVDGSTIDGYVAVAFALQLNGLCKRLLTIGRDYALIREQFGRPIAAFQAVQHLLAGVAVSIAGADTAALGAVHALGGPALRPAALVAAGTAVRALTTSTRAVQQILGAIGYTKEHEFPRYLYRGRLLSFLLESSTIDDRVAAAAIATGVAPVEPAAEWYRRNRA